MPYPRYQISMDETVPQVAELFDTTVPEIMAANNLPSPDHVYPGRELVIPVKMDEEDINPQMNLEGGIIYRGGSNPVNYKGIEQKPPANENPKPFEKGTRLRYDQLILKEKAVGLTPPEQAELRALVQSGPTGKGISETYGKFKDVSPETLKSEFDQSPISAVMKDTQGRPFELTVRKGGEVVRWDSLSDSERYDYAKQFQSLGIPGFRVRIPKEGQVLDLARGAQDRAMTSSFEKLIKEGKIPEARKKLHAFRVKNLKDAIDAYDVNTPDAKLEKHLDKIEEGFLKNLDYIDAMKNYLDNLEGK